MLAANFQIFEIYLLLEKGVLTENVHMYCLRSKHIKDSKEHVFIMT